jgi:hypothetical protein
MLDAVLLVVSESVELAVETMVKVFVLSSESLPFSMQLLDTGIKVGVVVVVVVFVVGVVEVVLYP